jgi:hypothetical protein
LRSGKRIGKSGLDVRKIINGEIAAEKIEAMPLKRGKLQAGSLELFEKKEEE